MELHSLLGAGIVILAILIGLAIAPYLAAFAGTKAAV